MATTRTALTRKGTQIVILRGSLRGRSAVIAATPRGGTVEVRLTTGKTVAVKVADVGLPTKK